MKEVPGLPGEAAEQGVRSCIAKLRRFAASILAILPTSSPSIPVEDAAPPRQDGTRRQG